MAAPNNLSVTKISHSNIRILRFLTSVLCYLFLLAGSVLIIHYANLRGNPPLLKVLYYISLALNALQVILVTVKFIVQQLGYYKRALNVMENILGLLWEMVIIAIFALSCVLFEAFRYDYLLIALAQGIAIGLMLIFSRKIDYKVNRSFSQKLQKSGGSGRDAAVMKRRKFVKSALYVFVSMLIFFIQVGVLMLPKLPPRIDDIFSPNRVLKYTYFKDVPGYDDGYYVSDIYFGINDSIVIPLTYNNEPVVGILSGAISDVGVINSIRIGEPAPDGKLISNVRYIGQGAIRLNRIKTIELPSSIVTMRDGAVSGESLESVIYHSTSPFSITSFAAQNLRSLTLTSTTEAVHVEYGGAQIKVNVPLDLYNAYRQQYYADRKLFVPANSENYIIVDFETNADYYLPSRILEKNNAQLNILALKEPEAETSTFIMDTLLYNQNKYARDGFVSKRGYAFRGWYRDSSYTLECIFNDTSSVFFTQNTTIYARWEEIKAVELDWSGYFPYNEAKTTLYFVNSNDPAESLTLPKLTTSGGDIERRGFEALKWKYGDRYIEKTLDLYNVPESKVEVTAEWVLVKPSLSYKTVLERSGNATQYEGGNLTFTYDEEQVINYVATFSHELDDVMITYAWKKREESGSYKVLTTFTTSSSDSFNYALKNHGDSGQYIFEAVATAATGETASSTQSYLINIEKKELDISSFFDEAPVTRVYSGYPQELSYSHTLPSGIKVTPMYEIDGSYLAAGPVNAKSEPYIVRFTFEKVGVDSENYKPAYSYSSITITPKPVTANWEQSDSSWGAGFERVFDGNSHILLPAVNGICGTDRVAFILSNGPQRNVGTYTSHIIGIDNPNYVIDEGAVLSHTWSIVPKKISAVWGETTQEYSGKSIEFLLALSGILDEDKEAISWQHFTINAACDVTYDKSRTRLVFAAKDVGTYSVLLSSFNSANYILDPVSKTLEVTPANLTLSWEKMTAEYSGQDQKARLVVAGFLEGDELKYDDQLLRQRLLINSGCSYHIASKGEGKLVIEFSEKNAGNYAIEVNGISNDNYTLTKSTNTFTINPKKITGGWEIPSLKYDGKEQRVSLKITALHFADVERMLLEDFTLSFDGIRAELLKETDSITLNFFAKNAGTYSAVLSAFNSTKFLNNYVLQDEISGRFNIDPRPLTLTWSASQFVYNGTERVLTASIDNVCEGDVVNLIYTGNRAKNAGSYMAYAASDNPNYTTGDSNGTPWTIAKKDIEVSAPSATYQYDGKYKYFTVAYMGFETADLLALKKSDFAISSNYNVYVTFERAEPENDRFVLTFKAIDAKNYTLSLLTTFENYNIKTTTYSFTITPRKIEFTWDYLGGFVYSKTPYSVQPIFTNLCQRDDTGLVDTTEAVLSDNVKTNAGSYTAKLLGVTNPNYYVESTDNTLVWEIKKRTLSITWDNTPFTFNAADQRKTPIAANLCEGDSVTFSTGVDVLENGTFKTTVSSVNAGAYRMRVISIGGSSASNYALPEDVYFEYTIAPRKLSAVVTTQNLSYDGSTKYGISINFNGFPSATEVNNFSTSDFIYIIDYLNMNGEIKVQKESGSTSCRFNFGAKNAGTYTVLFNGSNNPNYVFDNTSGTFTVAPRAIQVSWPSSSYTYDGNYKDFRATITNKVEYDTVNISYQCFGQSYMGDSITTYQMKDAGVYTLRIAGVDNPNYTIDGVEESSLSKQFTINRKQLTLSYGSTNFVYNGNYQGVTLTLSGYITSDRALFESNPLSFVHSGDMAGYADGKLYLQSVNAGTYELEVLGLVSSFSESNYELAGSSKIKLSYSISKAPLTVTWSSNSLVYNGETRTVTAAVSGTLYTNALTGQKDAVSFTYSGNSAADSGSYTAAITAVDNPNYELPANRTFSWEITKRPLTLTWSSENVFTYSGKYNQVTLTITNFIPADLAGKDLSSFTGASGSMAIDSLIVSGNTATLVFKRIDAGTYYFQLASIGNVNYSFSSAKYSMVINKKTVGLSWSEDTFTYDGKLHTIECAVTGIATRDDTGQPDAVNITLSNNSKTAAGSYVATVTSISNANYALPSEVTKAWTIKKVKLSAMWMGGDSYTYNGSPYTTTLVISGFVNGDEASVTKTSFSVGSGTVISECKIIDKKVYLEFADTAAGSYTYLVNTFNNNNYEFTSTSKTVAIERVTLTATWTGNNSYTYNGESIPITLRLSGFVNGDENVVSLASLDYSFATMPMLTKSGGTLILNFFIKDAGSYSFVVNSFTGANYTVSSTSKLVNVAKKDVVVTWSLATSFTYNGTNQGMTMRIEGVTSADITTFISSLNVTGTVQSSYSTDAAGITYTFTGRNVGTYTASVSAASSMKNYNLASQSKSFTITAKKLSVSWTGSNSYVYSGNARVITAHIAGFAAADISAITQSNLTQYISYQAGGSSGAITPALTKTTDTIALAFSIKDAGSYTLSVNSYVKDSNYTITASSHAVEITKKQVAVIIQDAGEKIYNGLEQSMRIRLTGIAETDLASFAASITFTGPGAVTYDNDEVTVTFKAKDVGTYNVTVNSSASNYQLEQILSSFSIKPRALTASWSTSSGNFSDYYSGSAYSVTLTVSGFQNGEKFPKSFFVTSQSVTSYDDSQSGTVKLTFGNLKDAGVYSFSVSGFMGTNYTFFATSFTYTVKKIDLAVESAGEAEFTYDGAMAGRTIKIKGLLPADLDAISLTEADYSISPNVSVSVAKENGELVITYRAKDAGTHIFTMPSSPNANYNMAAITDSFTLKPRAIYFNAASISDKSEPAFSGLAEGESLFASDYVLSLYFDASYTQLIEDISALAPGTYYYRVELLGFTNYTITNPQGTFTIEV